MSILALLNCSASKLARPAEAKQLYRGVGFRLGYQYLARRPVRIMILSAKYGMVSPDDILSPYDQRIPTRRDQKEDWILRTRAQILGLIQEAEITEIIHLLSIPYQSALRDLPIPIRAILPPLSIGRRLQALRRLLEKPV